MRSENLIVIIFGAVFLFSIIMIFNQGIKTTGYATETSTVSNVTISTYFAIEMSANLSAGIEFGNVSTLPTTNQNATHNNDSENTTAGGATYNQSTSMWINVSSDSNTAVDFCTKADALNTSTGDEIGLGNETYANNTQTNVTIPLLSLEASITTAYAKSSSSISAGSRNFYRFWLDIPAGTAAGVYNNTVSFKGVSTGGNC
jgi:hypothetical protein